MQIVQLQTVRHPSGNPGWLNQLFAAKAAQQGGIVRRAVRDVEREVGRDAFIAAVAARNYHLLECADQFIVICRTDHLTVHR